VQIKPSRTTYQKLYPSHFDFLKAPDSWRVPEFYQFNVMTINLLWSMSVCFRLKWVKLVLKEKFMSIFIMEFIKLNYHTLHCTLYFHRPSY
jgi:hypothetical protein